VGRHLLLVALPIVACSLFFEDSLVRAEDFALNFFGVGHPYGAPFIVGAGPMPALTGEPRPTPPERLSALWFAVDVIATAAIALGIAWVLRIHNAWLPSVVATVVVVLTIGSTPPFFIRSYGFSYWVLWLMAFAFMAAIWAAVEHFGVFAIADRSGRRPD
jgi:hypothetical protein